MTSPFQPKSYHDHGLWPVNDLTRTCPTPGYLDYPSYIYYLTRLGHIRTASADSSEAFPSVPLQSRLQNPQTTNRPPKDLTQWRADQALWTIENLPHIIYEFVQPSYWLEKSAFKTPPTKTYRIHDHYLRDIPILPDYISSKLEGWRLEAWYRFDPRVSLADISARIHPNFRDHEMSTIQMRVLRFRKDCNVLGWVRPGKNFRDNWMAIRDKLVNSGLPVHTNSTRGLSWGLFDEKLGEGGGRIPVPADKDKGTTVEARPIQPAIAESSLPGIQTVSQVLPVKTVLAGDSVVQHASEPSLSFTSRESVLSTIANSTQSTPCQAVTMKNTQSTGDAWMKEIFTQSLTSLTSPAPRPISTTYQPRLSFSILPSPRKPPQRYPDSHTYQISSGAMSHPNNTPVTPSQKTRKPIPQDVVDSLEHDFDSTSRASGTPPKRLHDLRGSAAPVTPTAPVSPATAASAGKNIERVTAAYGAETLYLKTDAERRNISTADLQLVRGWHPNGSEERMRQLEYVLDPVRAPHGFDDHRGYYRSITDSHPHLASVYDDITYNWTQEQVEAMTGFVTPALNVSAEDYWGDGWLMPGYVALTDIMYPPTLGAQTTYGDPAVLPEDKEDSVYPAL